MIYCCYGGVEKTIRAIIDDTASSDALTLKLLVKQFCSYDCKLVLSVCTGSLFLAALGCLAGRKATSHWRSLPVLTDLCSQHGENVTKVVRARFVDSTKGVIDSPSRIITAGGVSCGLDATFYMLSLLVDTELIDKIAKNLDYAPRGTEE